MRWVRRALVVAVLVGMMIGGWRFAAENQEPVQLHYVAGEFTEFALWKVVLGSFAAGAGLVGVLALLSSAKKGLIARRYRKAIGGLEAEIHQLRNLPLAPESQASGVAPGPPQAEGALGRDG